MPGVGVMRRPGDIVVATLVIFNFAMGAIAAVRGNTSVVEIVALFLLVAIVARCGR